MPQEPKLDRVRRRRIRNAERKLHEANLRLARAERSIRYWSRILADLNYEKTCEVQPPLWSDEQDDPVD